MLSYFFFSKAPRGPVSTYATAPMVSPSTAPLMPVIRSTSNSSSSDVPGTIAKSASARVGALPQMPPMTRPPALTTAQPPPQSNPNAINTSSGGSMVVLSANSVSTVIQQQAQQQQQKESGAQPPPAPTDAGVGSSVSCPNLNEQNAAAPKQQQQQPQSQPQQGNSSLSNSSNNISTGLTSSQGAAGKCVRALYDYRGDPVKGQLSFNKDDLITLLQVHDSGWWTGELRNVKGYFPSTFVADDPSAS
jgi:hypothetical protein